MIPIMANQDFLQVAIQCAMAAATKVKDVALLPAPLRAVLLVHSAQGVIDNGGLQYFFEADFPGQPDHAVFVEAYDEIGASDAARALEAAVGLFPFLSPHLHLDRRNEFLDRFSDEDNDELARSPFLPITDLLCGNRSVWDKLKTYVEVHMCAFKTAC